MGPLQRCKIDGTELRTHRLTKLWRPPHPMASWCAVFSHLRIAPTYSFTSLSMLERYLRMLVRASSPVLAFLC